MVKYLDNIMNQDYTKKILSKIRESKISKSKLPPLNEATYSNKKNMLTEFNEVVDVAVKKAFLKEEDKKASTSDGYVISKNTPQFGDIRISQEEALIKTIGENIELEENALVYNTNDKTLTFSGKITSMNVIFQFKYNDPSGEGCYIWVNGLQLTETNQRTLGKIRDGFLNWKSSLIQNSDLLQKIDKAATEDTK